MTADILIVGGGIVGAACARMLLNAGRSVAILERDFIGGGATAAGMGHIVVMDDSEEQFTLTKRSRDLWDALVPQMPPELEFERRGTLWVAADEEELAAVSGKQNYYAERGVPTELLDAQQLAAAEPALRPGMAGGFLVPGDSVIYAPCAADWLAQGATVLQGQAVALGDGVLKLHNGDTLSASAIILATGAAAIDLMPSLPLKPRKGHLAITDRYPGAVHHQLVELGYLKSAHSSGTESVACNIQPRKTGQLLIGSSRQFGVTHSDVEPHLLSQMLNRALHYLPLLAEMNVIRTWTGFRAATPDHLPIVGLIPGTRRNYLATGHEGLGITTSLGTAELIADAILGRPGPLSPSPYLADRFPECHV
ncbi:NAD(P)/FAD-dependent oxidoreductase [Bryobacter aggregatus]|uniref:NAD(P)/FAD-dependent oxidoreductase n=1 Tax=Bryobacter aggregatus TaxID=360054 RepID=UPI0004E16F4D|nr:FAD-dependent oxidoreductase [Bryobacter aggregatus]